MRKNLLQWQWSLHPEAHTDRRNLVIHLFSVPLFMAGTLLTLGALAFPPLALAGLPALLVPLAVEGAGHRREHARPVGFLGATDFAVRFFVEQWVSFPRYVLSGRFAEAWRRQGD